MELFRRIALGLVATASALVASFATIQSPSNNLASTNIDNSTSQQSIVEEKEARTIYNSAPQTQELDQETKTQLLKISANPDKSIKIQIDKNLIKKPNSTKAVKSSNKFKTILPSIGFGAAAQATPSGSFRIKSQNGNLVDVFGDSLPRSKGPVHLWNSQDKSNLFALGPNEGTGNEIRIASDTSLCITPDSPLNSKPKVGTPIVAKRDCSNSYNFKFDGAKIYLGRYPDLCLDIPNNNDSQSQRLQVFDCNGSSAQSFETVGGQGSTKPTPTPTPTKPPDDQPRDGASYDGPRNGSANGFYSGANLPKFCDRYINEVKWVYRNIYDNKYDWSLRVEPSDCGRKARIPATTMAWKDLLEKTPYCTEYDDNGCAIVKWNKNEGTSKSNSMKKQYECHVDGAWITWDKLPTYRKVYHLDPWRPDTNYVLLAKDGCNVK
jgi:Protein of unknown function (DUF2599)